MSRRLKRYGNGSAELSIQMLKAVLEGATYVRVGRDHGVTRTAVERRVKRIAGYLARTVGIDGVTHEGAAFVRRLRANRHAILQALEGIDPAAMGAPRGDREIRVYSTEEILAAASRVHAYSSNSARDVAMFMLLFATGLRPLEVARLRVCDYLAEDGQVRRVSQLPANAAIHGIARPLFFASSRLNDVLLPYLLGRLASGVPSAQGARNYRGLDPDQSLFLAADGRGFEIAVYEHDGQRRYLCRPVLETYRKIFRHAGLPDATPIAVRATVAARLYARGADDKQVGLLLGISQRSNVRQLFPRTQPSLAQLLEELI